MDVFQTKLPCMTIRFITFESTKYVGEGTFPNQFTTKNAVQPPLSESFQKYKNLSGKVSPSCKRGRAGPTGWPGRASVKLPGVVGVLPPSSSQLQEALNDTFEMHSGVFIPVLVGWAQSRNRCPLAAAAAALC